jgi:hypothetical protein
MAASPLPLPPPQVPLMDASGKPTQQGFEFLDRLQSLTKQLNAVTNIFDGLTATQATALLDLFTSTTKGLAPASGAATTFQRFTSGSGNYVPPPGLVRIKVRMIGGGGGGGAATTNAGSVGTDTSFGSWTALHGLGGGLGGLGIAIGGNGGSGGANGTGTPITRDTGAPGDFGNTTPWSGFGGCAHFGGGGKSVAGTTAGVNATANSGAGGGGGSQAGGTPGGGGGGGEGEYVEFVVASPGTIAYTVGGGGSGGAAGGQAGGNGAAGIIVVEEFYL